MLFAIFILPESRTPESVPSDVRWLDARRLAAAIFRPAVGAILLAIFLTTFAFAQFESTLSLLTEALGLSARYNFLVFAYIGFVLSISQGFLVRRLVPKVGEFRMSVLGAVLMTIGLGLIGVSALAGSRSLLYAVLPVSVVGFSALTPSLQSLLSRHTSEDEQGGMLGLGQSLSALARILGPMLGIMLEARGSALPYWCATGMMLVGVVLVFALKRHPVPDAA